MSKISDRILDEILQRCDITDVISSYIPLKKAGRNYKALCPFHHEKTPSFIVSPDKQIFHCFGCGAGGDVFSFIMKNERMEFPEAVRFLAEKAGVKIQEDDEYKQKVKRSAATLLYKINELALWYFQKQLLLPSSKQIIEYLGKRGISNESIRNFRIGFAIDAWDGLWRFLKSRKVNERLLLRSGLFVQNAQGRVYDRFRNRIIFPIFNAQGRIVGFGGRIVGSSKKTDSRSDEKLPKYINSPETEIYIKSKNLYGLNFSKKFIQEHDCCIVVEGYLDFIVPFAAGVKNLVASLGTAFTTEHLRILKRYTKNIIIVFDCDEAGQAAALRSLDLLLEEGMNVKITQLLPGYDPDSFIREHAKEEFENLIKHSNSLFIYKLNLLKKKFNIDVPEEKVEIASSMLETIRRIKDTILRATYVKKLSEVLKVKEELLVGKLNKMNAQIKSFRDKEDSQSSGFDLRKQPRIAEKMLISLMFEDASLIKKFKQQLHYSEFNDPGMRKVAEHLFFAEDTVKPTDILKKIGDQDMSSYISNLLVCDFGISNTKKSFEDCVRRIKKDNIQMRLDVLQRQISGIEDADKEKVNALLREYHRLKKEQRLYEKASKK